jgi:hypothetical protein
MIVERIRGILWSQVLSQVVYETNADVAASYEVMVKNPLVVADRTEKGLLWFKFRDNGTVFLLSPLGKLQVKWNDVSEKRTLFRLIRNLLVPRPNEKLSITPRKQQTYIDYPVPDSFKLYWCDQTSEFVLKKSPEAKEEEQQKGPVSIGTDSGNIGAVKRDVTTEVEIVRETLNSLRCKLTFFREPTLEEVAFKLGREPGPVLEMLLGFAGWKRQSPRKAEKTAEKAINLAGWLRWRKEGKQDPELETLYQKAIQGSLTGTIERAQAIFKNCSFLAPSVGYSRIEWPRITKDCWRQVFHSEPPEPKHLRG